MTKQEIEKIKERIQKYVQTKGKDVLDTYTKPEILDGEDLFGKQVQRLEINMDTIYKKESGFDEKFVEKMQELCNEHSVAIQVIGKNMWFIDPMHEVFDNMEDFEEAIDIVEETIKKELQINQLKTKKSISDFDMMENKMPTSNVKPIIEPFSFSTTHSKYESKNVTLGDIDILKIRKAAIESLGYEEQQDIIYDFKNFEEKNKISSEGPQKIRVDWDCIYRRDGNPEDNFEKNMKEICEKHPLAMLVFKTAVHKGNIEVLPSCIDDFRKVMEDIEYGLKREADIDLRKIQNMTIEKINEELEYSSSSDALKALSRKVPNNLSQEEKTLQKELGHFSTYTQQDIYKKAKNVEEYLKFEYAENNICKIKAYDAIVKDMSKDPIALWQSDGDAAKLGPITIVNLDKTFFSKEITPGTNEQFEENFKKFLSEHKFEIAIILDADIDCSKYNEKDFVQLVKTTKQMLKEECEIDVDILNQMDIEQIGEFLEKGYTLEICADIQKYENNRGLTSIIGVNNITNNNHEQSKETIEER